MYLIGITGNSGSGSSTLGGILADSGVYFISADDVYHQLLDSDTDLRGELAARFCDILDESGGINRAKLAAVVFAPDGGGALADLERITHPRIVVETLRRLSASGAEICAVEAVKLIQSGMAERCRITVATIADPDSCAARIAARDGITAEQAHRRLAAQPDASYYLDRCDIIIDNNGSIDDLRAAAAGILHGIAP